MIKRAYARLDVIFRRDKLESNDSENRERQSGSIYHN